MKNAAIYLGYRFDGTKLYQEFKTGKKSARFRGVRGVCIGYAYEYDDKKEQIQRKPKILSTYQATREQMEEWYALSEAAQAEAKAFRLRKELQKKLLPKSELQVLRRLTKNANYSQLRTIVESIVSELWTERFTK